MTRSVTAVAPIDNAEANTFLRELARSAPTVAVDATQEETQPDAQHVQEEAQPAKLPDAHAGNGAYTTGPAVQTPAQLMNAILRGVRR